MRCGLIISLLALAVGVTSCAHYEDYGYGRGYGDYRYEGRQFASRDGGMVLDPWLAHTPEGRDIVATGFSAGPISADRAHRANIWFRRYADTDRNLRLTDEEIRVALVQASPPGGY
jgi:hypothetical protein